MAKRKNFSDMSCNELQAEIPGIKAHRSSAESTISYGASGSGNSGGLAMLVGAAQLALAERKEKRLKKAAKSKSCNLKF